MSKKTYNVRVYNEWGGSYTGTTTAFPTATSRLLGFLQRRMHNGDSAYTIEQHDGLISIYLRDARGFIWGMVDLNKEDLSPEQYMYRGSHSGRFMFTTHREWKKQVEVQLIGGPVY